MSPPAPEEEPPDELEPGWEGDPGDPILGDLVGMAILGLLLIILAPKIVTVVNWMVDVVVLPAINSGR